MPYAIPMHSRQWQRQWQWVAAMFPVGALRGVMVANFIGIAMHRVYECEVILEVRDSNLGPPQATNLHMSEDEWLKHQSEEIAERLQSPELLQSVFDHVELARLGGAPPGEMVRRLRISVECEPVPGTRFQRIRFRCKHKDTSSLLAHQLVRVYERQREDEVRKETRRRSDELRDAIHKQYDIVRLAQRNLRDSERTRQRLVIQSAATDEDLQNHATFQAEFDRENEKLKRMRAKQIALNYGQRSAYDVVNIHTPIGSPAESITPKQIWRQLFWGFLGASTFCILTFLGVPQKIADRA